MGREENCVIYENQRYYGPMGWCASFRAVTSNEAKQGMDSFSELGMNAVKCAAAL